MLLALQRAHSLLTKDNQAAFYLALQLTISKQIPEVLGYICQDLQLQGYDVNYLHLLALLLSVQKHYSDAVNIIDMALSEYPKNFILFSKMKLESLCWSWMKHSSLVSSCYKYGNPVICNQSQ